MKVGVLIGFESESKIIKSCENFGVRYEEIDILSYNWLDNIAKSDCDIFFARPPCTSTDKKQCYDERVLILEQELGKKVYPSQREQFIYENKRYLSYLLKVHNVLHPETNVFLDRIDAIDKLDSVSYPIVFKSNVGSSSTGVTIVKSKRQALKLVNKIFGSYKSEFARGLSPKINYKGIDVPLWGYSQRHYLITQEFIDFEYEWRVIILGSKVLAYKKLKDVAGFASGSGLFGYGLPEDSLIERAIKVSKKLNVKSVALDFFVKDGSYYLNEAQALFGAKPIYHNRSSQMYDSEMKACYYELNDEGHFLLKYGDICQNECYDLRLKHMMEVVDYD